MIGLVVLIALAVGGGALFLATFDVEDYRETILAELKVATGREVAINGKIDADIWSLKPAVVVRDVSIANADWGQSRPMARLKRLEVRVSLVPLLMGDIDVRRLVAAEPDILLETDAGGRRNWELDGRGPASGSAKAPPPVLSFHRVEIRKARIAYRDGATGHVDRFTIDRLNVQSLEKSGRLGFTLSGDNEMGRIRAEGAVSSLADLIAGKAVAATFSAEIGGSDLAGKLVLQVGERVSIKGTVNSRKLSLSDISGAGKRRSARLFDEDPLPIALLRAIDANIAVAISTLVAGTTAVKNVKAGVRVANSMLTIDPFEAEVAGGRLAGKVELNAAARPPKFASEATLRRASLVRLAGTVNGPVDVILKVTGSGTSPRAIAATLNGHTALIGGPGTVRDGGLALLTFGIGTFEKLLRAGEVRTERVNCVVARFDFQNGIGRSRVVLIDSQRLAFVGSGVVNLKTEALDVLMVPRTKDIGLGEVTIQPVRVRGPLVRPSATVDASAAAKQTAKNIVGVAERSINFVGSLIGVTGKKRQGSACGHAIGQARGKAPPRREAPTRSAPNGSKKLLQRLNPFD